MAQSSVFDNEEIIATNYVHRLAVEYRDAGISVIPLRLDGSKAPALPKGGPQVYRQRLATNSELASWFSHEAGVGLICGWQSGGLEVLDFDDGTLFEPWREKVSSIADRLPVVETPSLGWHVLYRCDEIGGNCKIALDPDREQKTLIETRGEGGYIVGEGSPLAVHATGLAYAQYSGPSLPSVPRITPEERTKLWRAARSFDRGSTAEAVKRSRRQAVRSQIQRDVHPIIATFCERATWDDLLSQHGWNSTDGEHWTRPGKRFGTSARLVTALDGVEVLTVFSANAGPLAPISGPHRTWNIFDAWAALEFGGDNKQAFKAAAQEVAA